MSYDPTNLANSRNLVRFYLGGALTNDVLTDDEIDAYLPGGLLAQSSTVLAAISCGDYLLTQAYFAVDVREGGASASLSQLAPQLEKMVARLRSSAAGSAGPAALVAVYAQDRCGDDVSPAFTRQMGDVGSAFSGTADCP